MSPGSSPPATTSSARGRSTSSRASRRERRCEPSRNPDAGDLTVTIHDRHTDLEATDPSLPGRPHLRPAHRAARHLVDDVFERRDPPTTAALTNALGIVHDHLDDVVIEAPGRGGHGVDRLRRRITPARSPRWRSDRSTCAAACRLDRAGPTRCSARSSPSHRPNAGTTRASTPATRHDRRHVLHRARDHATIGAADAEFHDAVLTDTAPDTDEKVI